MTATDQKAHSKNAAYLREYTAWREGMTPSELKVAKALGVDSPSLDVFGAGAPETDMARLADMSKGESVYFDEHDTQTLKQMLDAHSAEACRMQLAEILGATNSRMTAECLSLVTGMAYLGFSETSIAEKFNVTRAAISKRCIELCDKLNLEPARAMKSADARQAYRDAQNGRDY